MSKFKLIKDFGEIKAGETIYVFDVYDSEMARRGHEKLEEKAEGKGIQNKAEKPAKQNK